MPKRRVNTGKAAEKKVAAKKQEEEPVIDEDGQENGGGDAAAQEVALPKKRGRAKKPVKEAVAEDVDDEDAAAEVVEEPKKKPARGRGAKKAKEPEPEPDVEDEDLDEEAADEPVPDEPVQKKGKRGGAKEKAEKPAAEEKPKKGKGRGAKKTAAEKQPEASDQAEKESGRGKKATKITEEPAEKPKGRKKQTKNEQVVEEKPERKRQAPSRNAKEEEPESKVLKNATVTKWESIDFDCQKSNKKGQLPNLKITSWNVDGIRAWLKKGGMEILKHDDPDIFCLQETKCAESKLPDEVKTYDNYHIYWCCSEKDGYAGVALYSKIMPIEVKYGIENEDHDQEGRCITAEYEKFFLVNVYVPNAGRGLVTLPKRLEWNELFQTYVLALEAKKPVIITGDMNVAHTEIDLKNPKTNVKNAGFTVEEREGMTDFLKQGFVDSFRYLYPGEKDAYTFWSYMHNARSKNVGWRLDYFILSKSLLDNLCDVVIIKEALGSDHCPLTLFINL